MISFKCPHCQKAYKLKDDMAGKKATCQACRKIILVPPPAPAAAAAAASRAAETEAMAAALFADAPAAPAAAPTFVKHKCQHCDTVSDFPADKVGKNAPCPECGRVIRIPIPADSKKKDWRTSGLPTAAKVDMGPEVEGAFASAQVSVVSRASLQQADAIPIEKDPIEWGLVAKRGALVALVLIVCAAGGWFTLKQRGAAKELATLQQARELIEAKDAKATAASAAAVYAAGAEHLFGKEEYDAALDELKKARFQALKPEMKPAERNAMLAELAQRFAALGGKGEFPSEQKRNEHWDRLQSEIRQTVSKIDGPESREERVFALRQAAKPWVPLGQAARLADAARTFPSADDRADGIAAIGLELTTADKAKAEELANAAAQLLPAGKPPDAPRLLALWLVLGKDDKAKAVAPEPTGAQEPTPVARLGYAEGYAQVGKFDKAKAIALAPGRADRRLRGLLQAATVAADASSAELGGLLDELLKLGEADFKGKLPPAWPLYRAGQLSLTGKPDLVAKFVALQPDAAWKGWQQLDQLRVRLATAEPAEVAWAEGVGAKESLAQVTAYRLVATRLAQQVGGAALKQVDGWDEKLRPAGYAGLALAGTVEKK